MYCTCDTTCQGPSHGGSYMDEGTFTLGLDCSPSLFQGTILPLTSMPPLLFARAYPMSDDRGVVLVRFTSLVIMCVGARLHGTLYPMTGCVLYLDELLC